MIFAACCCDVYMYVYLCLVFASADELTNDVEKLREAEKSNQETICHYEAEFKVFDCI